jgi:hypothetical protein
MPSKISDADVWVSLSCSRMAPYRFDPFPRVPSVLGGLRRVPTVIAGRGAVKSMVRAFQFETLPGRDLQEQPPSILPAKHFMTL